VLAVSPEQVLGGTLVSLSGAIEDPAVVAALTDGLARLTEDGLVVVDLSNVAIAPLAVVTEMVMRFGDQLDASKFRLVCSRLSGRRILRRSGIRLAVFASVAEALTPGPVLP